MKGYLLILGSITHAFKAKKILFNSGISAYVERNRTLKEYGCGYGVFVTRNHEKAVEILKENNVLILAKIFRE